MRPDVNRLVTITICVLICAFCFGCASFKRHNEFNADVYTIATFAEWEKTGELRPDAKTRWATFFQELQKSRTLTHEDHKKLFLYAEAQRAKRNLKPYLKDLIEVPEAWLKP
jgi:hypothetical protein